MNVTILHPERLLEFIDSQLTPKPKEKKQNGEVFTPLTLVNEMMDKLDESYTIQCGDSIFSNPGLKWLDPAVGIGNFPIIVYQRLMKGLELKFPDDEERRLHILEKMIYSAELNPANVIIYKSIFCGDKYRLNIYEGDSLKMDIVDVWGVEAFDVVMGNPPYNKGGIHSPYHRQEGDKRQTIWIPFVDTSFERLKVDGFLVFITPLGWLKKTYPLHNKIMNKHIHWLKLWDSSQSKYTINGEIAISLYVLQNTRNTSNRKTEIISELRDKKIFTKSFEYLNPEYSTSMAFHSVFNKVMKFINDRNLQLEYNRTTVKSTGLKIEIPDEYTLDDMWAVETYRVKDGLIVKKSVIQHPDANKRKLIIANKSSFRGAFIDDGKLGLTGNEKMYILGENLEIIKNVLDFEITYILCESTKYRMGLLNKEICSYIPDFRKLGITHITEAEYYTMLELTPQEIASMRDVIASRPMAKPARPPPYD